MQEAIQEQERQRQEMISRIARMRNEREAIFQQGLDQQREQQERLLSQQRANNEAGLRRQRQDLEDQISANASARETSTRNQNQQQIRGLQNQIQQTEQKRDSV